jgi:hypothetical protein
MPANRLVVQARSCVESFVQEGYDLGRDHGCSVPSYSRKETGLRPRRSIVGQPEDIVRCLIDVRVVGLADDLIIERVHTD